MSTFWSLIESAAEQRPEQIVLADDDGRSLTTVGLRDAAMSVAAGLVANGIGPGDSLSWQLPTIVEAPVLMAACARLGVVQNPIIPLLREREVGFILAETHAQVMVAPESWRDFGYADMARDLGVPVLAVDLDDAPGPRLRLPVGETAVLPDAPGTAGDARWIYYSSGTTADPKGVRHSDCSVIASANGVVDGLGMTVGEVYPIAWPFAHIGGIAMFSAVLRAGGCLALFDRFEASMTPARMAAHSPTILGSATPFFAGYVAAQREHGSDPLFPRLRVCVAGGAPTPATVISEVSEVLGVSGIVNSWGMTEFPVATSESARDTNLGSTVGRPVTGVQVRIVAGELQLKGPQCFLGYVDAQLDRDAFEDGWLRTGDLGSVGTDGRVRVEGRSKDVIIRNAENISALEVEEALAHHPDVADVAVIGVPDDRTGERVCAVVVARPGAELALKDLVDHCRTAGLARYKWPEELRCTDVLPRSSMGKVLKRDLRGLPART